MAIVGRRLSLEEFLELPEQEPGLEFMDGVVTQKVSPKARHGRLQPTLWKRFNDFGEPRRLAMAFTETRATFGGFSPVPDIVVYRWDRIPYGPDGTMIDDFLEPPDIAVEIVSPDQSARALVRRCRWYVGNGVAIALLVDPDHELVMRFQPDVPEETLRGPDRIDPFASLRAGFEAVLPGFELTVRELFDALRRR